MTGKATDEMLMAYIDGELDTAAADDVRRATERDATLARRAEEFRSTREWAKRAFAGIKSEPAMEKMIAVVLANPGSNVVPLPRRQFSKTALPLAASVALAAGLAGYWFGQQVAPNGLALFNDAALANALGETPGGQSRVIRTADGEKQLESLATYKVGDGYCRSFALTVGKAEESILGVGCARGGDWRVEIAVIAGTNGAYVPASTGGLASIDAFLDAAGAREALSAEEEAALPSKGRLSPSSGRD